MAIAFDAASSQGSASSASLSFSHTCTGADRFLVVVVCHRDAGGETCTGVTYNGVAMTQIGTVLTTGASVSMTVWGLVAPATGANDVVATLSAAQRIAVCACSYTGVHQASPLGTPTDEEDGSIIVTSETDQLVVAAAGCQTTDTGGGNVGWTSLTERVERRASNTANDPACSLADITGGSPNTTCAWTPTNTTGSVFTLGVALLPAGGGGPLTFYAEDGVMLMPFQRHGVVTTVFG